ncbi:MAG TPA: lamin tail domain-containing protein, partial [Polyangiaceae bacterium]|nr:lamin tail domain-containing protein [Polyangiaceae bacterium]
MRSLVIGSLFLASLLGASGASAAGSSTIVISEFRTRGPNGMNDEFIELHNKSSAAVNIAGWQVMLSNDLGQTTLAATIGSGVTIPAARFYLLANKAAQGYSGSVAPDATYTSPIADDGGIALFDENSAIVDQVGMSTGSAYFEGTPLSAMMANANQSYERNFGGCSPNQD